MNQVINKIGSRFSLSHSCKSMGAVAVLLLAGCQSTQQALDATQPQAIQAAESRARFDMACPEATGSVLSREEIQPGFYGGMSRPEYTVGVSGCGKRETLVVVCPPDGSGCIAGDGGKK